MMKRAATLLAALTLAFAAAPPAPAAACGDTHRVDRTADAQAVVDAQFAALAAGDVKAFKKTWSRDGRVTTRAADGEARTRPVRKLLKRWLAHRDGMTWQIESVTPTFDGAEVRATVVWNGTTYDDVLTVRDLGDGRMVIVEKQTTARAEVGGGGGYGA